MKKSTAALCMVITVMLSFTAGFFGAGFSAYLRRLSATEESAPPGISIEALFGENNYSDIEAVPLSYFNTRAPLTIPEIASAVAHTVVEIQTERVITNSRFGQYVTGGAGSGVILTTDGYIATCSHVIENASKITVTLKNGRAYDARVIGRDAKSDLAVIKIDAENLLAARFGNSNTLTVGELAVAVGNPLGSLGGTVTEGIISALDRDINIDGELMNLLQTSAAINPGNSGGGLFNAYGELIGVVNAKPGGANIEGIGFAIPANSAKSIINQLTQNGYVEGRVDFGIMLVDISDMFSAMRYGVSGTGVFVGRNDEESGLRAGDRIVSVNGTDVKMSADVKEIYEKYKVGDVLKLIITRGGRSYTAEVKLKQAR